MSSSNRRLQRLIESRCGGTKDVKKYTAELASLLKRVGDDSSVKREERLLKALADSIRLKILRMLAEREMCVCELMIALGLTQPNASHHLGMLERAGIIKRRKEGKWAFYSLAKADILKIVEQLSLGLER